jgi:hypothetical protein
VRLEKIDELRRRTNASYEAAKDALEKCNDDMLDAIVYLERQSAAKPNTVSENKSSLWTKFKALVRKGNKTKLSILKKENVFISLPVTLAVIITLIAPYLTLIGLGAALVTGHRIRFEGKDMECSQVNAMLVKVSETVDSAKKKLIEETSSTPSEN